MNAPTLAANGDAGADTRQVGWSLDHYTHLGRDRSGRGDLRPVRALELEGDASDENGWRLEDPTFVRRLVRNGEAADLAELSR